MNRSLKSLAGLCSGLCLFFSTLPAGLAETEDAAFAVWAPVVASVENSPGWRFTSNRDVPLEAFSAHQEMSLGGGKPPMRGFLKEGNAVDVAQPYFSAAGDAIGTRGEGGVSGYAITSYTMHRDAQGSAWLQGGHLLNRSFAPGVDLRIFVNGKELAQHLAPKDRRPFRFQQNLGPLRKGDVVSVAVGPAEGGRIGGGRLRFSLAEWPEGKEPPPLPSLLWIPMEETAPQYDASGLAFFYIEKNQEQAKQLLDKDPELVFMGDSITARWPEDLLATHFGEWHPVKLGVAGDWIQNVRWRVARLPLGQCKNLRLIVLLIGTNNLSSFSPEEVASGMAALLEDLKAASPQARVLLLGILPRGTSLEDPMNRQVRPANQKLAPLADGKRVFFLDVGPSLVEADGSILPEVLPDRLHVALPGFQRWMEAMKPVVVDLLERPPLEHR